MTIPMDLAQRIFAFLHVTGMDRSHPDAKLARELALRMWKEVGGSGKPLPDSPDLDSGISQTELREIQQESDRISRCGLPLR